MNYKKHLEYTNYLHKEMIEEDTYSFESLIKEKTNESLSKKKIIFEPSMDIYSLKGRGNISLSNEHTLNYQKSLVLETNTDIENVFPRPSSTISFSLDHVNLNDYNYIGAYVYVEATGYEGFYFHFMTGNNGHFTNHAPIVIPNKWQFIRYSCDHIVRDDVNVYSITPYLMGCPPEALGDIKVYIDSIFAFKMDKIYDLGFDLENRIAYSHSGYLINGKKTALVSKTKEKKFTLVNLDTNKEYLLDVLDTTSRLGDYSLLDFSEIKDEGKYIIKIGDISSFPFEISNTCFYNSILKSINFLRSLRCGEHIEGVHTKCHLNCKTYHHDNKYVPNFGGWHDAGDVSQFLIPTAEISYSLLDLYGLFDNKLNDRILEEARVGLDWLAQTRFKDGYRAMAVTYSIWRENVLEDDNKTVLTNKAERGAFENFLSALAFAKGSIVHKENQLKDTIYKEYLQRLAIEDYNFALYELENNIYTVRWGKPISSQTLGLLVTCASLLYKLTGDNIYTSHIIKYTKDLMKTQETNSSFEFAGFFYEDLEHKYILTYEHRGHYEYPVLGLISAYETIDDESFKSTILSRLLLYKNYVQRKIEYTSPYYLLPANIYKLNSLNLEHFTKSKDYTDEFSMNYLNNQIKNGFFISEDWYLRIHPVSFTRRGFLATLLSETVCIAKLGNTLKDKELLEYSIKQVEWMLGHNPFSSSMMYKEGYNYHNLYVAFSNQIVGALPVGMKTKDDLDLPYWPDYTNAVFKEIWGHTSGKYLGVIASILRGVSNGSI